MSRWHVGSAVRVVFHQYLNCDTHVRLIVTHSSLRIKTYSLLATLCQHAKSLVYGQVGSSGLPKLLTNALTQEKEASNVSSLMEVLLLYLTNFPDGNSWRVVEAPLLVKNMGKQLKKACHGASASHWGPTMLPLLASFSDDTFGLQLQLLKNMVSARGYVCSCSFYLFLYQNLMICG